MGRTPGDQFFNVPSGSPAFMPPPVALPDVLPPPHTPPRTTTFYAFAFTTPGGACAIQLCLGNGIANELMVEAATLFYNSLCRITLNALPCAIAVVEPRAEDRRSDTRDVPRCRD